MYAPSIVRKDEIARCSQGSPGAPSVQHQFSLPSLSLWQPAGEFRLVSYCPVRRKETHSFGLESLDGLHVCVHVIGNGFELFQDLLCLVNNGLVLQRRPVMGEIDCRGLVVILMQQPLSFVVTLAEGLERSDCL